MRTTHDTWNADTARERCRHSVEACEQFFSRRYSGTKPTTPNEQAFYDLCFAEYEVRKHLLAVDCFSSREALLAELQRLLQAPVIPSSLPCNAECYLECQKRDIEMQIKNLTQPARKRPWWMFHRSA
jgi:hypothetical protein